MNGNAGELLRIMKIRLEMQRESITKPPDDVKVATQALVDKLSRIDASEEIEVISEGGLLARYIRVTTGEVIAEIHDARNT